MLGAVIVVHKAEEDRRREEEKDKEVEVEKRRRKRRTYGFIFRVHRTTVSMADESFLSVLLAFSACAELPIN